jgi:hypothetical protein
MSHGKILTLDTSFNIKKKFGVGYNLLMESKMIDEVGFDKRDPMKSNGNNIMKSVIEGID